MTTNHNWYLTTFGNSPATITTTTPVAHQLPHEYHHEYTTQLYWLTNTVSLYTPCSIEWSVFLKINTIGLIYKNKKMKKTEHNHYVIVPGSRLHLQDTFQLCPWPIFLKPNHWFPYKNLQTYFSQDSKLTTGFTIQSATA